MTRALVRYLWIDNLRSHSWVAPALTFALLEGVLCVHAGSVLPTYAALAVVVLFVSTWITVVTLNGEDPVQIDITTATVGSFVKVRLAKLLVALLATAVLVLAGLVGPLLASSTGGTVTQVAAGAGAQLLTALTGVAIGALLARPIVSKRSWSVLAGFGLCLATVVVPYGPPARQLLVVLDNAGSYRVPLALITLETLALTVIVVAGSTRLARRLT